MVDVASIVTAVGGLTVVTTMQQVITGALDERRKVAETKRAGRREPLDRRHLELGNLSDADALAERQNSRLVKQVEALQAEVDKRDAEILRQRGEIAQLYRDLYNTDRRRPP